MKVLIIGDIVGRPGRTVIKEHLTALKQEFQADLVVANGENASGGVGIVEKHAQEFLDLGIDVVTTGNHVWDKKETEQYIDSYPRLLRPANYPSPCPGHGIFLVPTSVGRVAILNLSGRTYMKNLDCPFRALDRLLEEIPSDVTIKILDFHGEATSEKLAMGFYAAKRVSLVFGTHTHVQTADWRILEGHTGYITDVGMTGPYDGIIGVDKDMVLKGFLTGRPSRFDVAKGKRQVNALVVQFDAATGQCLGGTGIIRTFD